VQVVACGADLHTKGRGGGVMVLAARFLLLSDQNQGRIIFTPRLKVGSYFAAFLLKSSKITADHENWWNIGAIVDSG
jgi:hypothetical protein